MNSYTPVYRYGVHEEADTKRSVKLVRGRLMKPLADTVGLKAPSLRPGMLNPVKLKIELIRMLVKPAAKLGPAVCQNPQDIRALIVEEG